MPLILEARCDACDYALECSQSETFAVFDDGSEEVLGHPGEEIIARHLTGKGLSELAREKRLRYKYGLICRGCGKFDLYINPRQRVAGHIWSIVSTITPQDADEMVCVHCGSKGLQSVIGERVGCLGILFGYRPKPNRFACPKCRRGWVDIRIVGMS